MSTTILSASSSARRNVASTTKVAPCRRCAGPKTSPSKLWAIITWSRTVTLNTSSPLLVGDHVCKRRAAPVREGRQHVGQFDERRGTGDQRVERRIAEQFERQRQPVARGPRVAAGRRDPSHLAGPHPEPGGVEGAA